MKILHTSDWHLGRTLYGCQRYPEFKAFLEWLLTIIKQENIELLLISGDIFDTSTPSNQAQQLYYQFLHDIQSTGCINVVIIAGNHDSPSFLNAPKQLLQALNINVVSSITDLLEDELIILKDQNGKEQAIICAVPYLRDKDIRTVNGHESFDEKYIKLQNGIRQHYAEIAALSKEKQFDIKQETGILIPIIAMGHLFTAKGQTIEGDGVRDLYVGSLACIDSNCFAPYFDYVALGHLHIPQYVNYNNGSATLDRLLQWDLVSQRKIKVWQS